VKLTVTVTDASPVKGTPTGTVTFIVDSRKFLSPLLLRDGKVTLKTSNLPFGTDAIEVVYSGDPHFKGSKSAVLIETVNPPPGPLR
jgi:hypothetical protein